VAKDGHYGPNPCLLVSTALDCADRPETIKRWSNPTNTMVATSKGQGGTDGPAVAQSTRNAPRYLIEDG